MDKELRGVAKPKRGQANKRERVRTENVNAGFENLRKLIPTDPEDRKLSKIEVLRLATSYINHLYNLTKANSCLESERIDKGLRLDSIKGDGRNSDEAPRKDSDSVDNLRNRIKSSKSHVCTFCLMMTKTTSPLTSTKRK